MVNLARPYIIRNYTCEMIFKKMMWPEGDNTDFEESKRKKKRRKAPLEKFIRKTTQTIEKTKRRNLQMKLKMREIKFKEKERGMTYT